MRVSREVQRRFVLGRQGLWPGRRFEGLEGTRRALRAAVRIQVDPLDVVGRSHDLAFATRVESYRPEHLETLLYRDRDAYEHGGGLFIFPREHFPVTFSKYAAGRAEPAWDVWGREHRAVVEEVRREVREHGPVGSHHFREGTPVENYRSRRLEGVALHYLWRRMEILIHHRSSNRKFYDLRSRTFGPDPPRLSSAELDLRTVVEVTDWLGLAGRSWISHLPAPGRRRRRTLEEARRHRKRLTDAGHLATVELEREREPGTLVAPAMAELETLAQGEVPDTWTPLRAEPEALLLAPLEVVSARGRAKELFDFEYRWEVYTPAAKRRWGYYVLPVLLGDRLVGRIEPVREPARGAVAVRNAWWEPGVTAAELGPPLARALRRMARSQGLEKVRIGRLGSVALRTSISETLARPEG